MNNERFQGIYALLLTPFREDGAVDWPLYERYVEWQLSHKPHHLFAVCGSSEMRTLDLEERLKLAELAVHRAGTTPVVATANVETAFEAQKEEIRRMEATGVSAIVLTTQGLGDEDERLIQYVEEMRLLTSLPVILYEFPGIGPRWIRPSTYKRLVDTGQVIGVKDTTCTMEGITGKLEAAPESHVLQANIPYVLDALRAGAGGVMSTLGATGAPLLLKLWEEVRSRDAAADDTYGLIVGMNSVLGSCFPATGKYFVSLAGIPFPTRTRQGKQLEPAHARAVKAWYDWAVRQQIISASGKLLTTFKK